MDKNSKITNVEIIKINAVWNEVSEIKKMKSEYTEIENSCLLVYYIYFHKIYHSNKIKLQPLAVSFNTSKTCHFEALR